MLLAWAVFYFIHYAEQTNSEKEILQKTLSEERSVETEKLKEELQQRLETAAEQHEMKLQTEINKGIGL